MKEDAEYTVVVPGHMKAARADKVMAELHPELSRSRWQKLFKDGRVWGEDHVLSQKQVLRPGASVSYSIPPAQPLRLHPVEMALRIVHEDEDILVIDKDPGMVVHPGAGTQEDTLVHGLLYHCRDSLSGIGGTERPGIVHRLDKETSGAIIVAKTERAYQSLALQFSSRKVQKRYCALVVGATDDTGRIREPIGRHPTLRTRMTCRSDGRPADTEFWNVQWFGEGASLIELLIRTGRTHQIRVHMKQAGHLLLGDTQYGYKDAMLRGGNPEVLVDVPRVMLHAARLEIEHPVSGEAMVFRVPVREDFMQVTHRLEQRYPDA